MTFLKYIAFYFVARVVEYSIYVYWLKQMNKK